MKSLESGGVAEGVAGWKTQLNSSTGKQASVLGVSVVKLPQGVPGYIHTIGECVCLFVVYPALVFVYVFVISLGA